MESVYPAKKMNVGPNERAASILGGGGMLLLALRQPSRASLGLALSGGYLIYRGLSGRCAVYDALGIERAELADRSGIVVDRTLTIACPPEEVYQFWRDFANLPTFMQHLDRVEITGDRTSHWVARGPLDRPIEWDAEIFEERENEKIAWRSLAGADVENSGVVEFIEAPGGRGTEVQVTLRYNPPGGSAAVALAHLFGREPEQQISGDLRRFKQMMETGETATVLGQTSGRVEQTFAEREQISQRRHHDEVEEASQESFPASDPPTWTTSGGAA
jgi:uncharacterized membrane protein